MSGQAGGYQRSASGMIGAMLVLLLGIGVFIGFRSLRGNQDTPPPAVPYAGLAREARQAGVLTAPTPRPLPDHWRVTSAGYDAGRRPTWHLGILTDRQTYVAVEEAEDPAAKLVATYLGKGADQHGTVDVDGTQWTGWGDGSSYALTRTTAKTTVYVGGRGGRSAAIELAGRLGS